MLAEKLDAFEPDAIHLATEGPLGWAGRAYCLRRKLAFTTAFHTKFPEILNAAAKVPLSWGYALFRHFHRPSSGVMVPTHSVLRMLEGRGFRNLRAWTHGVDTKLFEFQLRPRTCTGMDICRGRSALFVGRVSYEKNIEAFLNMDFPGSKVVCGVGPVEAQLKRRHPQVRWLGLLPRDQLAKVYAAADLFVFPSRADTFGLVMVEAMATGTPVAAYPVDGPLRCWAGAMNRAAASAAPCTRTCKGLLRGARRAASRSPAARAGFQLAACHCTVQQLPGPRAPALRGYPLPHRFHDRAVVIPFSTGAPEAPAAAPDVPFLDRDHSILAFDERVLDWARRADVPLLERLRYLCIVSSNLDEFFELRAHPHLDGAAERRPQGRVHGPIVRGAGGGCAQAGRCAVRALQRRTDAGFRPGRHRNRFAR